MVLTLALVQMGVTESKARNMQAARQWLQKAADRGAGLAVLPEMFTNPYQPKCFEENSEPLMGGVYEMLAETSRDTGMWIVGGTFAERGESGLYNTCLIFSPEGKLAKAYRKTHLFDVHTSEADFSESKWMKAGSETAVVQAEGFRFGVAVCFDVRFPEWFRLMQGAELIVLPAAFHPVTGAAHWRLLMRARALDNQCFMAGAAPAKNGNRSFQPYAHSMICSPWGEVMASLEEGEGLLVRGIDLDEAACTRRELPVLKNRRSDLYAIKTPSKP